MFSDCTARSEPIRFVIQYKSPRDSSWFFIFFIYFCFHYYFGDWHISHDMFLTNKNVKSKRLETYKVLWARTIFTRSFGSTCIYIFTLIGLKLLTNQSATSLLDLNVSKSSTSQELLSDLSTYLTVLYWLVGEVWTKGQLTWPQKDVVLCWCIAKD